MTDRHPAWIDDNWDENMDTGEPIARTFWCGDYDASGKMLCPKHLAEAEKRYPQGWSHYPGDVCVHGKYTGGSGIDWMCQYCENGDVYWHNDPSYQLMVSVLGGSPHEVMDARPYWVSEPNDIALAERIIERAMTRLTDIVLASESGLWHFKGKPVYTYHAVQVASGYWHDEPQVRIQLDV